MGIQLESDMFGMIESLATAAVGAVIEIPVAIVVDVVTVGRAEATADAIGNMVNNIHDATQPSDID